MGAPAPEVRPGVRQWPRSAYDGTYLSIALDVEVEYLAEGRARYDVAGDRHFGCATRVATEAQLNRLAESPDFPNRAGELADLVVSDGNHRISGAVPQVYKDGFAVP